MNHAVDWEDRIDFPRMRRERTARLQATMPKHNLDGLLTFAAENIRYMTGMRPLWWPIVFVTRSAAIIAQQGDPVLYATGPDVPRARATMNWLPQENIRHCAAMDDPGLARAMVQDHFAPTIREMGLASGRIGLDVLTMPILDELRAALPDAQFVNGSECVKEAKVVKGSEEIKCLRASIEMSDVGIAAAMGAIGLGARECEVLAEAMRAMYRLGMEVPQCNLIVSSGEHTAPLHRFASDRPIRRGDLVFMDIGGCLNGYFSDQTRTVIYGQPNDEQRRVYACAYEMMTTVHELLKPGNTNQQLNDAVRAVMPKHGFDPMSYVGLLGHSCGTSGFETPLIGELAASGQQVFEFEPGMMFNCEPTVILPGIQGGGGVRLEDNILVTETGNEMLNRSPFCLKLLATGNCADCGAPCAN